MTVEIDIFNCLLKARTDGARLPMGNVPLSNISVNFAATFS